MMFFILWGARVDFLSLKIWSLIFLDTKTGHSECWRRLYYVHAINGCWNWRYIHGGRLSNVYIGHSLIFFFFFESQRAWEHENIWTVPLTRCSIRFVAPPKTWDALMLHWQQQLLCRWWKETGADGEQSTGYVVPSLSNVVPEDPIRSRLMTAGGESGSWVQLRSPALSSRKQDKQWNWT